MANTVGKQAQRPAPAPGSEKRNSEAPLSVSLPKERTTEPPPNRGQDRSDTIPAPAWFEEETE